MEEKVSLFSNQTDNVVETAIKNKIKYTDYNYFTPIEAVKDIRQRLSILRRFNKRELRVKYWEKLLATGKDSVGGFIELIKDVREIDFQFHDNERKLEHDWIFKKLQTDSNHRIDMLPDNVDLIDLIRDLNEVLIKNDIIFNIGGCNFMLTNILFSMKNLSWLSMNNSGITKGKIHNIVQVINRGQLNNLKAIVVTNNPGLKLSDLKEELRKIQRGKLQYLEIDLVDEEDKEGDDGILEKIEIHDIEFRMMNDGKKLKYLIEKRIIKDDKSKCIIDYGIVNKGWSERVRLGLADSSKSLSYKVNVNREEAKLRERVVSEKISTSTIRCEVGSKQKLAPVVKRPKTNKGIEGISFGINKRKKV